MYCPLCGKKLKKIKTQETCLGPITYSVTLFRCGSCRQEVVNEYNTHDQVHRIRVGG